MCLMYSIQLYCYSYSPHPHNNIAHDALLLWEHCHKDEHIEEQAFHEDPRIVGYSRIVEEGQQQATLPVLRQENICKYVCEWYNW